MKGLTLVEVLIAAGISAVVGIFLLSILINSTGLFYQQTSKVTQGVGSNDALAEFRAYIKETLSIVNNYPETGQSLYTTSNSQVVLKITSLDLNGNIKAGVFDYVVFYLDQDKLKEKIIADVTSTRGATETILTSNVESLLFQYFDLSGNAVAPDIAEKARMTLTLRQKAGAGFVSHIATSEASLRND
jgi:hypothetical protein